MYHAKPKEFFSHAVLHCFADNLKMTAYVSIFNFLADLEVPFVFKQIVFNLTSCSDKKCLNKEK